MASRESDNITNLRVKNLDVWGSYRSDMISPLKYGTEFTDVTIQSAIDNIGSDPVTLLIPSGTWVIDADVTIPSNVTLRVPRGSILQIATGKTLTINGTLEAGLYQIFDCVGTGSVNLFNSYVESGFPEWWGALRDGTTDDSTAINQAIQSSYKTYFSTGTYKIETALEPCAGHEMVGGGHSSIIYRVVTTPWVSASIGGDIQNQAIVTSDDCIIKDLAIIGNFVKEVVTARLESYGVDARPNTPTRVICDGLLIRNFERVGISIYSDSIVRNCIIYDIGETGVFISSLSGNPVSPSGNMITNNIIKDLYSWGIDCNGTRNIISNNLLENCGSKDGITYVTMDGMDGGGICVITLDDRCPEIHDTVISNNIIKDSDGSAIKCVNNQTGNVITNLNIEGNVIKNVVKDPDYTGNCISIQSLLAVTKNYNINVSNNIIKDVPEDCWGIKIKDIHDVSIVNNQIYNVTGGGIYGSVLYNAVISSNNVFGNNTVTSTGIKVLASEGTDSANLTISANMVTDCGNGLYSNVLNLTNFSIINNNVNQNTVPFLTHFNEGIFERFYLTSSARIMNNLGINPIGSLSEIADYSSGTANPSMISSLGEFTNIFGCPCKVYIIGGTVSAIKIGKVSGSLQDIGITSGMCIVEPGEIISITYTLAPTWEWFAS